jgi:hypothetical protein
MFVQPGIEFFNRIGKFCNGTGAQRNQRYGCRRYQSQIDRDGLTFGRTPQTIDRPVCGLGTVTERNRKYLLQKDAVNLSSLTGSQHWLADRRIGGKHRASERPPLSATEWSATRKQLGPYTLSLLRMNNRSGITNFESDARNTRIWVK